MSAGPFEDPFEPDPFAEPLFDPATGELLDLEGDDAPPTAVAPVLADGAPVNLGAIVAHRALAPDVDGTELVRTIRDGLLEQIDAEATRLFRARRPGPVTRETIADEVRFHVAAAERLAHIATAFTAAADHAKGALPDLLAEAVKDTTAGGTASAWFAEAGGTLRVGVTQPTKVTVDAGVVEDVIVAEALEDLPSTLETSAEAVAGIVRDVLDTYRGLVGPPAWKTTALEAYELELAKRGEAGLAARLAESRHRKPHGKAQVSIRHYEDDNDTPGGGA